MKISYEKLHQLIRLDTYKEIADNYEELITLSVKTKWDMIKSQYENFDKDIEGELEDTIEMLKLYEYRMKLMTICCLSEIWEQDLYNFLKEQQIIDKKKNEYKYIKNDFNRSFPNQNINNYPKIKKMRDLVNAIKHGNGSSMDSTISSFGQNILANSNLGYKKDEIAIMEKQRNFDDNALTSITLNVDGLLTSFSNEIIKFWEDVFLELNNKNN